MQSTTADAFVAGLAAFGRFQRLNCIPCVEKTTQHQQRKKAATVRDLEGQVFVFSVFRDVELEKRLRDRGADVKSTVSRNPGDPGRFHRGRSTSMRFGAGIHGPVLSVGRHDAGDHQASPKLHHERVLLENAFYEMQLPKPRKQFSRTLTTGKTRIKAYCLDSLSSILHAPRIKSWQEMMFGRRRNRSPACLPSAAQGSNCSATRTT